MGFRYKKKSDKLYKAVATLRILCKNAVRRFVVQRSPVRLSLNHLPAEGFEYLFRF